MHRDDIRYTCFLAYTLAPLTTVSTTSPVTRGSEYTTSATGNSTSGSTTVAVIGNAGAQKGPVAKGELPSFRSCMDSKLYWRFTQQSSVFEDDGICYRYIVYATLLYHNIVIELGCDQK